MKLFMTLLNDSFYFCGVSCNYSFIYHFIYLGSCSFFLDGLAKVVLILFIFSKKQHLVFLSFYLKSSYFIFYILSFSFPRFFRGRVRLLKIFFFQEVGLYSYELPLRTALIHPIKLLINIYFY